MDKLKDVLHKVVKQSNPIKLSITKNEIESMKRSLKKMTKLTDKQMKKFQELFSLDDLYSMQFALECEYGLNDDNAKKLLEFLEGVKEDNNSIGRELSHGEVIMKEANKHIKHNDDNLDRYVLKFKDSMKDIFESKENNNE